ncbi:MAG TPA: hypothetical protein DCF63_13285 [Planctomycetaceae bacterium]|nr:hypothetical protein [Planctomycetaceae bacterium]
MHRPVRHHKGFQVFCQSQDRPPIRAAVRQHTVFDPFQSAVANTNEPQADNRTLTIKALIVKFAS